MSRIYILLTVLVFLLVLIVWILSLKFKIVIEAKDEAVVYLKILFLNIKLTPRERKKIKLKEWSSKRFKRRQAKDEQKKLRKQKKKERAKEKKKQKKALAEKKAQSKPKKKKTPADIADLVGLVAKLAGEFFSRFSKRLRLDITKIHITVGGEDAAATAISYGIVCQAVNLLLEILDSVTNISPKDNRDIKVDANFLSQKTEADIKLSASLRVWHIFDMLLSVAVRFVKEKYFKNYKL